MIVLVYDGQLIHFYSFDKKNLSYYLKLLRCILKRQKYDTYTHEEFYSRGGGNY